MTAASDRTELDELKDKVAAMESLLHRQADELAALRAGPKLPVSDTARWAPSDESLGAAAPVEPLPDTAPTLAESRSGTRRAMLLGGLGAAGAAAAVVAGAAPAAAASGDPVVAGTEVLASSQTTVLSTSIGVTAFAGISTGGVQGTGLLGSTESDSQTNAGVRGYSFDRATGVLAESFNGAGLWASSGFGPAALLQTARASGPPPASGTTWVAGSLLPVADGTLWYCVESGEPGIWRRMSSVDSAGSFTSINPARAYDSRYNSPAGRLAAGSSRSITVATAYSPDSTNVVNANLVPAAATAVMVNLTAVATANTGYLFVAPGDATSVTASSVNWTGVTNVANALTVKLGPSRSLKVFCGTPGASAHFIVDVLGYYL